MRLKFTLNLRYLSNRTIRAQSSLASLLIIICTGFLGGCCDRVYLHLTSDHLSIKVSDANVTRETIIKDERFENSSVKAEWFTATDKFRNFTDQDGAPIQMYPGVMISFPITDLFPRKGVDRDSQLLSMRVNLGKDELLFDPTAVFVKSLRNRVKVPLQVLPYKISSMKTNGFAYVTWDLQREQALNVNIVFAEETRFENKVLTIEACVKEEGTEYLSTRTILLREISDDERKAFENCRDTSRMIVVPLAGGITACWVYLLVVFVLSGG